MRLLLVSSWWCCLLHPSLTKCFIKTTAKHSGRLAKGSLGGVQSRMLSPNAFTLLRSCKGNPGKTGNGKNKSLEAFKHQKLGKCEWNFLFFSVPKKYERQDLKLMNQWVSSHKIWEFPLEVSAFQFPCSWLLLSSKQWHPPSMQGQRSETGTARLGTTSRQKEFVHPGSC